MNRIVLATRNPGKLRELRELLGDLNVELLSLEDFPDVPDISEDSDDYAENALKKAKIVSYMTGLPAIADDSGLEVDALGGEPGVLSSRYFGPVGDRERCCRLLKSMAGVPSEERAARFRCVVALADPNGWSETASGVLEGFISEEIRGEGGFGYDPIFYLPQYGMTVAELPQSEKNRISHRGQALRKAVDIIRSRYSGDP
ncbi:MAG: XTP/dITP diphosphatase [bacterium]